MAIPFIHTAGHPSTSKRGDVWIYFKHSLPSTGKGDISTMKETIKIDIWMKNMLFYMLS